MRKMCVLFTVVFGLALLPASASALNFKPAVGSPISSAAPNDVITTVTTGNFNSDIYDDVAAVTASDKLYVWLTQSDGAFQPAPGSPYALNFGTIDKYSMWAEEMTGDFRDDLVIQSEQFPGTFYTFFNNGDGSFPVNPAGSWAVDHTGPPNYRGAAYGKSATLADLTGDGCSDLLVGMFERSFQVAISNCAGGFTRATSAPVQLTTPLSGSFDGFTATEIGDYNGDGDADIALMLQAYSSAEGPRIVYVMHGDGSGLFGTAVAYYDVVGPDNSFLQDIETIDQNGDQYDDLLVLTRNPDYSNTVTSLLGGPSGLVANPAGELTEPFRGANVLNSADFDGDGAQDVGATLRGERQVNVALGDGVDSFAWDGPWDFPQIGDVNFYPNDLETPDLNGDGFADIVSSSSHSGDPNQARGVDALISRPDVGVDKTSLSFPETAVGQESPAQTVTISVGAGPSAGFSNSDFSVVGTGDSNYSLDTNCPGTIDAGETCTVDVTFDPSTEGTHNPDLEIKTPDGDTITIPMSGVTGHEEMSLTADDGLAWHSPFGYSQHKTFTITSTGTWPTEVSEVGVFAEEETDEDFWLISGESPCQTTLAPGQTCSFDVYFEPIFEATVSEADVVAFNAIGPLTEYVEVTGNSTISDLEIDNNYLPFDDRAMGTGPSTAKTFTLTPKDGFVPFDGIDVEGSGASSFTVTDLDDCPNPIPAEGSCRFAVTFEPKGGPGFKKATLNVDAFFNVASEVPRTIELQGTGLGVVVPPPPDPPTPEADLTLTVKSAKKVKRGKKLLVTAIVQNVGNASTLNPVTLSATSPKKTTKAVKAVTIPEIRIGETLNRKFLVPVRKNAKGRFRVKVSLAYDGHVSIRKSAQTAPVTIQKPKKKRR